MEKLEAYKLYYEEDIPHFKSANSDIFDSYLDVRFENYKRALDGLTSVPMDGISREADAAILCVFALRAGLEECLGWLYGVLPDEFWYYCRDELGEIEYEFMDSEVSKLMREHLSEKYETPLYNLDAEFGFRFSDHCSDIAGNRVCIYDMTFGDCRCPQGKISYPFIAPAKERLHGYEAVLHIEGDVLEFPEEADNVFKYILRGDSLYLTHLKDVDTRRWIPADWQISDFVSAETKSNFFAYTLDLQESWYKWFMGLRDED